VPLNHPKCPIEVIFSSTARAKPIAAISSVHQIRNKGVKVLSTVVFNKNKRFALLDQSGRSIQYIYLKPFGIDLQKIEPLNLVQNCFIVEPHDRHRFFGHAPTKMPFRAEACG